MFRFQIVSLILFAFYYKIKKIEFFCEYFHCCCKIIVFVYVYENFCFRTFVKRNEIFRSKFVFVFFSLNFNILFYSILIYDNEIFY